MGGGSAPKQPDPIKTAEAQTKTNLETMEANARFNQINQVTPFGKSTWTGEIGSPDRTQTTSLDPRVSGTVYGALDAVRNQGPLSFSGAPEIRNSAWGGFNSANNPAATAFSSANNPNAARLTSDHFGRNTFSSDAGANLPSSFRSNWNDGFAGRQMLNSSPSRQGGYDPREHGSRMGPGTVSGGPQGPPSFGNQDGSGMFRSTAGQGLNQFNDQVGRFNPFQKQGDQSYGDFRLTGPDDFGAERASIEQSVFDRGMNLLRPEFDRQEKGMNRDLWQRGLTDGSQAVNDTRLSFGDRRGRAQNDLALASVMAGSQEHQRLSDLNRANRGQLFGEDMAISGENRAGAMDQFGRDVSTSAERRAGAMDQFGRDLSSSMENRGIIGDQFGRDLATSAENRAHTTDRFNRDATGFGLNEQAQQNAFGRDAAAFGLDQQAIQNAFGRDASSFGLTQQAIQQAFGRDLATSAENRAGVTDQFGRDVTSRQQSVMEAMAKHNAPMQKLSGLLGAVAPGGTPQMPQYTQFTSSAPDIMGMTGSNYASAANAHANQQAGMMGMFGSIGGGMLGLLSDRRIKRDIKKVGKLHNGLNVYLFRYKGTNRFMIGLMADEVEEVHPHAVHKSGPEDDAFKVVDYSKAVERKEE